MCTASALSSAIRRQGAQIVGLQDGLHLVGIQLGGAFGQRLMDKAVGVGGVGGEADRQRRRLFQLLLVAAIFHHMHKGGHRAFRRAVGGNGGLGK